MSSKVQDDPKIMKELLSFSLKIACKNLQKPFDQTDWSHLRNNIAILLKERFGKEIEVSFDFCYHSHEEEVQTDANCFTEV